MAKRRKFLIVVMLVACGCKHPLESAHGANSTLKDWNVSASCDGKAYDFVVTSPVKPHVVLDCDVMARQNATTYSTHGPNSPIIPNNKGSIVIGGSPK